MLRPLYKSADMEEGLSITLEPMGRLCHMRGHFGVDFMPNQMVQLLYKSADMEEDLSITLEPMGRSCHMRGHFGTLCPGCQGIKSAKGDGRQKVPRVPEFRRWQGCQELKGTNGA